MKKNLLLALTIMLLNVAFAQNRTFIINETFDSPNMPEGWYFTGEGSDNFKVSTTNNAGGDANELYFKSSPIVTAGIHLVMASVDLTDVTELGLSFKHYLNNYQLSSTIGIATSSDNGVSWHTAWSHTYSESSSSGQYNINETISTSDMGKDNVLICLFYEGNTYNFNKWYFDDISIFTLGENDGADLQISSIDINNIIQAGNAEVSFTVDNIGNTDVTSVEASYEIAGHETVTETFNVNIAPYENKKLTFGTTVDLLPGTHEVKVNLLKVNDEIDSNTDNNTISKEIRAFIKNIERTPMIEHFSSATCINCIPVDTTLLGLTHDNEGLYTYVKYPWNYPGLGDKYYLEDCGIRGEYYGVTGVPFITFDGTTTTKAPKQSHFDERFNIPSYIDIAGAFDIDGNTIKVTADIISYIDMPNVKVFVTVNEKTTVDNVVEGSLPEFHHVLMNMLSGSEGIGASFDAGLYNRYEFSFDMSETNVEEMNDLEVAVWVQNYESKEIHNSRFLYEYTNHPYPVQNLNVTGKTISWEKPESSTPTGYNVYVNNKLVAKNTKELSHEISSTKNKVIIEVVALYENERKSVGVTSTAEVETNEEENVTAPDNVTANPNSTSSIKLTWNTVENAQSYNIYRGNDKVANVMETNYTDEGLEYDTKYCYTVTSVLNGKESEHSDEVCTKTKGESIEEQTSSFRIYPNPVNDKLYIEAERNIREINVYNVVGVNVYNVECRMKNVELDVSDFENGIYFIKINTDKENIVKQFIKN